MMELVFERFKARLAAAASLVAATVSSIDDMRRVKIHREPPRRGATEDLPDPEPTTPKANPGPEPDPAAVTGDAPKPCSDRSSAQVNSRPRVTLTHDRVILDLPVAAPRAKKKSPPGTKPSKAKKMSKDKQELSFEGEMPVEKIITYLRGLADGLAEGTVPVESGLDRVVLEASPSMTMKIKAKVKKRDNALKVELTWTTPEGVGLKIGAETD